MKRYYLYSKKLNAFSTGFGSSWAKAVTAPGEEITIKSFPTPFFGLESSEDPRKIQESADVFNIALSNFNHAEAMKPENQYCIVIEIDAGSSINVWQPPEFVSKHFYKRKWPKT
jgi:hypothetical protein